MSRSENRRRTTVIAVRCTSAEKELITRAAGTLGFSLGRFMRECALMAAADRIAADRINPQEEP